MKRTVDIYKKVEVETTTDSIKLIVMLYEGAINFLGQAKLRTAENQPGEKGILINKVIAIISELQCSLNMAQGGDVANSLDRLYTYMISRLLEANTNQDTEIMDEVLKHLRTLKNAWSQISNQQSQPAAQPAELPRPAIPPVENNGMESEHSVIELVG